MNAVLPYFRYRSSEQLVSPRDRGDFSSLFSSESKTVDPHEALLGRITQTKDRLKAWIGEPQKLDYLSWCEDFSESFKAAGVVAADFRLAHIDDAIARAQKILDLPENWDDYGAKPYSKQLLGEAVDFVVKSARDALLKCDVVVDAPEILPGPDGSIDLHWKNDKAELLVNFPANGGPVTFYGDNYRNLCIRGTVEPSSPPVGLLMFLPLKKEDVV